MRTGLVRGRGSGVCVCVLLRGGSGEVGGAVGGLFWVIVVDLVCIVYVCGDF